LAAAYHEPCCTPLNEPKADGSGASRPKPSLQRPPNKQLHCDDTTVGDCVDDDARSIFFDPVMDVSDFPGDVQAV
jgi:hypothetical protein